MNTFKVQSKTRNEMIDITPEVQKAVDESKIKDGVCYVFIPHTTAAVTINENADPAVIKDILGELERHFPKDGKYRHTEGNADAHIKTSIIGSSEMIFVENGRLVLGTWQSIFLCEFDGPRERFVYLKVV